MDSTANSLRASGETIIARLGYWAEHQPDKTAYTFLFEKAGTEVTFTYSELWQATESIARQLLSNKIQVGDRVLLLYPPGLAFLPAFLGCLRAGVIAVPAYPPRNARHMPRIELIVKDAEAKAALTSTSLAEKIDEWLNPETKEATATSITVIATDTEPPSSKRQQALPAFPSPGDLAFLQYTSGSTAEPKGVMVSHDNIVYNEQMLTKSTQLEQDSVWVTWLPVFHDMGLIAGMLHPLHLGAHCVFMAPTTFIQKPIRWLEAITKYRPAKTGGPNFAFEHCLQKITDEDKAALDLSSLKSFFNGSEPIRVEVMEAFAREFACCGFKPEMFFPCYGMAESTLIASANPAGTTPFYTAFDAEALENNQAIPCYSKTEKSIQLVGCGQSILEDTIIIADPNSLARLPEGRVGEIWIQGRHIALGYWNKPETTKDSFHAQTSNTQEGPFLRTGDLGFFHEKQLYICGRLKDLIIIHGRNIYPQDIEICAQSALCGLRASSGAAFSINVDSEERLVLVHEVEREVLKKLDYEAACLDIRQAIAKEHEVELYAIRLIKPGTISKTSSGKIQRKRCAEQFEKGLLKIVGEWTQAAPKAIPIETLATQPNRSVAEVSAWLQQNIAEHAKIPASKVDTAAPFANYALDSTKLIILSGDLGDWLQQEISATLLFDYPSIETLAAHLTNSDSAAKALPEKDSTATQAASDEAIAIIGMGCRLPGEASSLDAFWQLLNEGRDAIEEIPADRWDWRAHYLEGSAQTGKMNTRFGGFLQGVDQFDPEFFGLSPRETRNLDPQQRLLLEVAWETLENAAIAPNELRGSNSAIYIGISNNDYASLALRNDANLIDTNTGTGNALSAAAGRLAYFFGWEGPAMAIDTACSSSLVAVHQACQSLHNNQTNLSLAAGVNLILSPDLTVAFSQSQMMAADGRCKAFDESADGYVRSEGCGAVLLKRLSDAQRDKDPIIAVIKGSSVNQDGRSNGLTAPNGNAQEKVIQQALQSANLKGEQVSYVETHGTGTSLGDPIEAKALARAYDRNLPNKQPLWIGSVKTNLGHLEAAAGMASLIKTALALKNQTIPKSLHFNQPNTHIDWERTSLQVNNQQQVWPAANNAIQYAGISSFGFTGTNAHIIVGSAPQATTAPPVANAPELICLSARTNKALQTAALNLATHLDQVESVTLPALAQTLACGRQHFTQRATFVIKDTPALIEALKNFSPAQQAERRAPSKLCFLFTGQGSQYKQMAKGLYHSHSIFRDALQHCNELLKPHIKLSLLDLLFDEAIDAEQLNQTAYTQPALFAVEYSLAQLWLAWGQEPDAVTGHSLGEYVAACVAGVITLEDGLALVAHRGRLMQALPQNGAMTAVFASEADLQSALAEFTSQIGIASTNAPSETVLSGEKSAMLALHQTLEAKNINFVPLRVSHAFHSPLMEPMLAEFKSCLEAVTFSPPTLPLISNLTGKPIASNAITDPEYWLKHILQPVRFTNIVDWLKENNFNTFIEIGPKPLLSALAQKNWPENQASWISSLSAKTDEQTEILGALAKLYQAGHHIHWKSVYQDQTPQPVLLPNYPFQRQSYWIATAPTPTLVQIAAGSTAHPILGHQLTTIAGEAHTTVWVQQMERASTLPVAWLTEAALAAAASISGETPHQIGLSSFKLQTDESLEANEHEDLTIQIVLKNAPNRRPEITFYRQNQAAQSSSWKQIAQVTPTFTAIPNSTAKLSSEQPMQFGVMFFNGSESRDPADNYKLVLESTRFADQNDFSSVWVPERHYTEFGSLYPNPVVLLSALARETEQIRLTAGSIVMPLHSPLRVAEDWSLIDNLSQGRVGVSFASGWNPNDFAAAPENYSDRHSKLFEGIETVRKLWSGQSITSTSGDGRSIEVRTYPTPIQKELPFWVTAAGNPETFYKAGSIGANILTHLLDQDPAELATKLAEYRRGRTDNGYPAETGIVSVMVHTFVGSDDENVRTIVRAPYCAFLKENLHLLKGLAASRGREVDIGALSDEDKEEFVGFLFERFYAERALMGTPEKCQNLVNALADAGVNEIACLLDFGPSTEDVIANLPYLNQLKIQHSAPSLSADPLTATSAPIDLAATRQALPMELPASRFYLQLRHRDIEIAAKNQLIETFWRKDSTALAQISPLNANLSDQQQFEICLQTFACAIPDESFAKGGGKVYYPKSFARWNRFDSTEPATHCHTKIKQDASFNYTGQVTLHDAHGSVLAKISDLTFVPNRSSESAAATDEISDRFYEINWQALPLKPSEIQAKQWILLGEPNEFSTQLADKLTQSGQTVCHTDPLPNAEAFEAYFESLSLDPEQSVGILHLGALSQAQTDTPHFEQIEAGLKSGCASMLHLVQALKKRQQSAQIFGLTCKAQAADADTALEGIAASPLWGFAKVVALEHPELWGAMLDTDSVSEKILDSVVNECLMPDGEDQVAYRNGKRLVSRIQRAKKPPAATFKLKPDAQYLITGGLGGIGRKLADFLVKRGAKHLCLIGLNSLPTRNSWESLPETTSAETRNRIAAIQQLEQQGATVTLIEADVSQPKDMATAFEAIHSSPYKLSGIFHLAGKPEIRPIAETVFDTHRDILDPKIAGTWNLHTHTIDLDLDYFVCYSSISGTWGSAGQPFYSTANHFMDSFGHYRSQLGKPTTTINWGPWSEGGMLTDTDKDLLATMGIWGLSQEEGLNALEQLTLAQSINRVAVKIDWRIFKDLFETRGRRPLLSSMAEEDASETSANQTLELSDLAKDIASNEPTVVEVELQNLLIQELAKVLGHDDPSTLPRQNGFFEMGLDSLMAIELKNRLQAKLGLPLKTTTAFNYPTIDKLASYLAGELLVSQTIQKQDSETSTLLDTSIHKGFTDIDLDNSSDEALLEMLENELE